MIDEYSDFFTQIRDTEKKNLEMIEMFSTNQIKRYNTNCSLNYNQLIKTFLKKYGKQTFKYQSFF